MLIYAKRVIALIMDLIWVKPTGTEDDMNNILETKILIIGSGKLARHLIHWYKISHPQAIVFNWTRKHHSKTELSVYLNQCTHILLAISDSSIVSFYEENLEDICRKKSMMVTHFSGALVDSRIHAAHPLMSFPNELFDHFVYAQIYFALSEDIPLSFLLPHFTNKTFFIKNQYRPLYHALCVAAGNFPQLIWNSVYVSLNKLSIPNEAFDCYIEQITKNFIHYKENSLTGPLIRKDHETIEKNINALESSLLKNIYQAFRNEYNP